MKRLRSGRIIVRVDAKPERGAWPRHTKVHMLHLPDPDGSLTEYRTEFMPPKLDGQFVFKSEPVSKFLGGHDTSEQQLIEATKGWSSSWRHQDEVVYTRQLRSARSNINFLRDLDQALGHLMMEAYARNGEGHNPKYMIMLVAFRAALDREYGLLSGMFTSK